MALALHHGLIPPSLHFHDPSPRIAWNEIAVKVADRAVPWPPGRRTAGVSAFAFSGTNAHVILEEAPGMERAGNPLPEREWHVLALSAREEPALRELTERYLEWLERIRMRRWRTWGIRRGWDAAIWRNVQRWWRGRSRKRGSC